MSSCFHNDNGTMSGIDLHEYIMRGPKGEPIPTLNGYVAAFPFHQRPRVKDQARITIDGTASFQIIADWYLIPHTMLPTPPPHELELLALLFIVGNSSSKAWMGAHGVKLNGEPAAVCLKSCFSSNLNCAQPIAGVSGNVVVNLSSVVTEPTWGDYLGSAVRMCLTAVTSWAVGQVVRRAAERLALPIADEVLRDFVQRLLDSLGRHVNRRNKEILSPENEVVKTLLDPGKAISEWVQESVDRALEGSP